MRVCKTCKRSLPLSRFYKVGMYHRTNCKKCYNAVGRVPTSREGRLEALRKRFDAYWRSK